MMFFTVVITLCSITLPLLVDAVFYVSGPMTFEETNSTFCPYDGQFNSGNTNCIKSCAGRDNGDYQSCTDCHKYVTCSNGITYNDRACPASLVWDDNKKRCSWKSDTCTPPKPNGVFFMNLENSNFGEEYLDNTTWTILSDMARFPFTSPIATGRCDVPLNYKFTPPACIKTINWQITSNGGYPSFGLTENPIYSYVPDTTTLLFSPGFPFLYLHKSRPILAATTNDLVNGLFCSQIVRGAVSVSYGQGVGYNFEGNDIFSKMSTVPLNFFINVNALKNKTVSGICSLKVAWSC